MANDPTLDLTPTTDGVLAFSTKVPTCDFCGRKLRRTWSRFACPDFSATLETPGGPVRFDSGGIWGACPDCAPLVRDRSWRLLTERVLARWAVHRGPSPFPEGLERRWLAVMYLKLDALLGEETVVRDRSSKRRGGGRR